MDSARRGVKIMLVLGAIMRCVPLGVPAVALAAANQISVGGVWVANITQDAARFTADRGPSRFDNGSRSLR